MDMVPNSRRQSTGMQSSSGRSEDGDENASEDLMYEEEFGTPLGVADADERRLTDPEYVDYQCLTRREAEDMLNTAATSLSDLFEQPIAKLLLHLHQWDAELVRSLHNARGGKLLIEDKIRVVKNGNRSELDCSVCWEPSARKSLVGLDCGHVFCRSCWQHYLDVQLQSNGCAAQLECMKLDCPLLCTEDFILSKVLMGEDEPPELRARYKQALFVDMIHSHPNLHLCSDTACSTILFCRSIKGHRVTCASCQASFCIKCKRPYHAPTNCDVIKKWWTKCADDSETANYISVYTKDCPTCHSCIEKNGGCNHMQCSTCKHHFCWMCMKDWKSHGSEYYECSKYKENPSIAQEVNSLQARRALEKYLHYYERFENHNKSLKLEEELRERIMAKIEDKVSRHEGTWIDWQYLHDAATLLTKCRYTLQYTYPFAYYLEPSAEKNLFEYQQAQLEKEIEELSWKVERAETTDRGELESQMHVAEQKRRTLLQDFFN